MASEKCAGKQGLEEILFLLHISFEEEEGGGRVSRGGPPLMAW